MDVPHLVAREEQLLASIERERSHREVLEASHFALYIIFYSQ